VTPGLVASVVALTVALALGGAWRWNNGRMRAVTGSAARAARAARVAPARSAAASGPPGSPGSPGTAAQVTGAALGQPLGTHATLLQFSSAFCAPCRATRRILGEVAGLTDGVAHIEIDAESRLDLVRLLAVRRTPTVFVLGPDGRIAKRASGQPRKADVIAALGSVR
jgi:thiol-disulfide isomerase/thioredoxin